MHIVSFTRITAILLLLLLPALAVAQPEAPITKSKKTEYVEGRKYYLHTVEKGQTLYAIAKAYDVSVNDILVENPDALNGIKPGQVLRIPGKRPAPILTVQKDTAAFIYHKVTAGQTLYSISHQYDVADSTIIRLNPEAKNGLKAGQELRIPKKQSAQIVNAPDLISPDTSAIDTSYIANKKDVYNIALMLPLSLSDVDNIHTDKIESNEETFPPKTEAAVQFYEGALLAVDSMRRLGMNVRLHVYDMDDGDSARVQTVLDKPEFQSMDLLIGPLSPGPFYVASQWAKEHHVAIVSPVSPANRVLFMRPGAAKALPSTSTQLQQLALYIGQTHKTDNVLMITSGYAREQHLALNFRRDINKALYPDGNDSIRMLKGTTGLEAMLKKDRANVIVVPSYNQAFVSDVLRSLNMLADKYTIIVYGMSSWPGYDNLDPEYLEQLQMHCVAPYFIDYDSSAATTRFVKQYHNAFGGDPGSYVFAGYDVTLFFLNAMFEYGTGFYVRLPEIKGEGLQQEFAFFRSDIESGYENEGVHILRVQNYHLVKVQ